MKRLYLTAEEKTHLELRHQACENRKEGDRIKAILLRSEGWTVPQISQALRLHQSTIIKHVEEYKTRSKLSNESGGSASHLTDEQTEKLIAHLEENTYAHNHQIVLYIKEHFGVTYTVAGLHNWTLDKHCLKFFHLNYRRIFKIRQTVLLNLVLSVLIYWLFYQKTIHP